MRALRHGRAAWRRMIGLWRGLGHGIGGNKILSRVLLPAVLLVSVLGTGSHLQSAAGGEKGGPEAIEPGKKVKVTRGPAPVKVGKQTLTTVDAGAELMARKVQGNWVQVTVVRDGRSITGWIHRSRLTPSHALSRAGGQAPKERVVDLGGGVKMTLVLIPPGTFTMGSTEAEIKAVLAKRPLSKEGFFADQKPAHKVTISKAFWMGKHEVTVGQFRRFVVATAYKTDAEKGTPGKGAAVANHDGKVWVAQEASWRNP